MTIRLFTKSSVARVRRILRSKSGQKRIQASAKQLAKVIGAEKLARRVPKEAWLKQVNI